MRQLEHLRQAGRKASLDALVFFRAPVAHQLGDDLREALADAVDLGERAGVGGLFEVALEVLDAPHAVAVCHDLEGVRVGDLEQVAHLLQRAYDVVLVHGFLRRADDLRRRSRNRKPGTRAGQPFVTRLFAV